MGKKIIVICETCGGEIIRWKRYNNRTIRHFCKEHLLDFYKENGIKTHFKFGHQSTLETQILLSIIRKNKITPLKIREKMSKSHIARRHLHWKWKGGIYDDVNKWMRDRRHLLGISKKYRNEIIGHPKKYHRQKRKALMKGGGELTLQTIQQVYEDNIKQYGTLTCYLCLQLIPFGKDHLEHKIPLSRGGTNARDNLDIACQGCNCKKHNKTEIEYREGKNYVSSLHG